MGHLEEQKTEMLALARVLHHPPGAGSLMLMLDGAQGDLEAGGGGMRGAAIGGGGGKGRIHGDAGGGCGGQ